MRGRFRSGLQRIKTRPVPTVLIALLITVATLIILSILGYIFDWNWTGLPSHPLSNGFQQEKTLWDWMQLLIIPIVLAASGFLFTLTVNGNERKAADQRNKVEREIAEDNRQETTLQEYINKMSELLLDEELCKPTAKEETRKVARIRTLTVLPRLNGRRKGIVLQFLYEAQLINKGEKVVDLSGADLREVSLIQANLIGADLSKADLTKANLFLAVMDKADLSQTILFNANLRGATIREACLLGATLAGADLRETHLEGSDLMGTLFYKADLTEANLQGAKGFVKGVDALFAPLDSIEEIEKHVKSLKGATMPDGSKHP